VIILGFIVVIRAKILLGVYFSDNVIAVGDTDGITS